MTPSASTPSAYSELVAAIVKAVPDLDGGQDRLCPKCRGLTRTQSDPDCEYCIECDLDDAHKTVEWINSTTIIRPITLEDVLRAEESHGGCLLVDSRGTLAINLSDFGEEPDIALRKAYWTLGKSLEWHRDNAPEAITFLHSLLCK